MSFPLRSPEGKWLLLARFLSYLDVSLPLRSPKVSAPHSVAFFPCPDVPLPLALPRRCLDSMPGPALRWPFAPACLVMRPRLQRLEFRSDGFLSLASRFDAGGALGHGKCSAQDPQRSPSLVRADARGPNFPRVRVGVHGRARRPARPRGSGNRCVGHC